MEASKRRIEPFEDRIHIGLGRADRRSEGDGVPVGAHQDASLGQCISDDGPGLGGGLRGAGHLLAVNVEGGEHPERTDPEDQVVMRGKLAQPRVEVLAHVGGVLDHALFLDDADVGERDRAGHRVPARREAVGKDGLAVEQLLGISKSVISYHFDDKEELLEQVVAHVFRAAGEQIVAAVDKEATWSAKLAAYIRAELAFMRDSREQMAAATEIVISHRSPDGLPMYLQGGEEETALLQSILRGGQVAGDFGGFDVHVAALTILHAVDGALTQSQKDPSTDLDAYADHLVRLVLRMVGAGELS